jgi:hypothetical protein
MSLIRDAQEALRSLRSEHLAVDVVYITTADVSTSIEATQAATSVTVDDGETISKSKVFDWLIDIAQYSAEPMRGDKITYDGLVYIVADIGSEHCWRWHDSIKKTRRVHTKQGGV